MQHRVNCEYKGCNKTYCSSFNLKRHIESYHKGVRKFHCETCGRQLSSKQNYMDHKNTHTGNKPYTCDVQGCNKVFRQLSQFYIHKQIHDNLHSILSSEKHPQDEVLSLLGQRLAEVGEIAGEKLSLKQDYEGVGRVEQDFNSDSDGIRDEVQKMLRVTRKD